MGKWGRRATDGDKVHIGPKRTRERKIDYRNAKVPDRWRTEETRCI